MIIALLSYGVRPFAVFVWCVGLRSVGAWLRGLVWFGVLWCFVIVKRTFQKHNSL